jgi:hypothetical protein
MGADEQAGLTRADLARLAYTYVVPSYKRGRRIRPLRLAPMDRTYRDAPVARKRYSFSHSKIVTPGSAYSRHLEGSFLAGGELRSPSWFGTCRRTRSRPWVPICV